MAVHPVNASTPALATKYEAGRIRSVCSIKNGVKPATAAPDDILTVVPPPIFTITG